MNYSMLSARDAAQYTMKNRERPIICILSCIEGRIMEAINYRADAILWEFAGEDILYMDEVVNELHKSGYTVRECNETEDTTSFTIRISWL